MSLNTLGAHAADAIVMDSFADRIIALGEFPLVRGTLTTLQINTGKRCNLSCRHCHVEAGPAREETMSEKIFDACLDVVRRSELIETVDITGGAPELNPHLPWFIKQVAETGKRIIVRSNLAIYKDERYAHLLDLYAAEGVRIIGSVSDYSGEKTDRVRGSGVFGDIIAVMKILNALGYGIPGSPLTLDLMYNPAGAYLPAPVQSIEAVFKDKLKLHFGVEFSGLICINNMPVGRFLEYLVESGNLTSYVNGLADAFNEDTVPKVMCRNTLSVGWDGTLYDCDFNQMTETPVPGVIRHIGDIVTRFPETQPIATGNHCFGCTAGSGSSCSGALVAS